MNNADDLYHPNRVERLFDEMAGTYGLVNLLASFGFTAIWRRVLLAKLRPSASRVVVVDLMTGMGELFHGLRKLPIERLEAVDFSEAMCAQARNAAANYPWLTKVTRANVFDQSIPANTADVVVCAFGLKTFSSDQQRQLADEVQRLLKPGGQFSFIEISMPQGKVLKALYKFYIKRLVPLIGRFCLGNPDNYRMLGAYTETFGNSRAFAAHLTSQRLDVAYFEHFFGCASGVFGSKPH